MAVVGTGRVDPELLATRLAAVSDAAAKSWATQVTDRALRCLVLVNGVDVARMERAAERTPAACWVQVEGAVAAMWLELEEFLQALGPLVAAYEAAHPDADDAPSTPPDGGAPLAGIMARLAETAWAMSFVLSGELQAYRQRLARVLKLQEAWELVEALQDHLGHLRQALEAVLNGVYGALPAVAVADGSEQSLELVASRELRARLFELRDGVLEVERQLASAPPAMWRGPLARAHALVEGFVFGPGFGWMRATDKRAFLRQRRTLGEILSLYTPLRAEPARQAVANLARFLEAMEVLNQRECLLVHDRDRLREVVAAMGDARSSAGPQRREAIARGLAALAEVQGRDRELDNLLARTMAPGSPVAVEEIGERAQLVLAGIGGG